MTSKKLKPNKIGTNKIEIGRSNEGIAEITDFNSITLHGKIGTITGNR